MQMGRATAWRRYLDRHARRARARSVAFAAWPRLTSPIPRSTEVAWDLDPLLDGAPATPPRRWTRCSPRRSSAPTRSPSARRQASPSSTAPASPTRCASSAALEELVGRAGSYARSTSRPTPPTRARGALLQRVQEQATPIETKLLFFELEWAALDDDARRGAARTPTSSTSAATTCAPPAATGRTCSPSPRRRSWPRSRSPAAAPGTACSRSRPRRSQVHAARRRRAGRARGRAVAALLPRPRGAPRARRGRHRRARSPACARAATSSTRCSPTRWSTTGCARYPHWLASRNLANEASDESVAGARRGRPQPLRAAAPLVPPEGAAARARPARRTTTAWPRSPTRRPVVRWADARDHRAGLLRGLLARARRPRPSRFFDERWIDAPVRPGKRGGAFCAYTVPSRAPVRDAQLHVAPPRRADARARARPRRPRRARRAAQGVFHMATPLTLAETATVFGETIVFGRLLERAPRRRSRGCRCSPSRSRARSRPSSARSP